MKFLIVLAIAVACASADLSGEAAAPIDRTAYDSSPDGSAFNFGNETGNKIAAQVEGVVKNPNSNKPTLEVKGSYFYFSPDGTPVETSYIANENGMIYQGAHLPDPPPTSETVARILKYIDRQSKPELLFAIVG